MPITPLIAVGCPHAAISDTDQKSSPLVRSRRPIPFQRIGPLDRVEVTNVPIECLICHQPLLSLNMLERLEQLLEHRAAQGDSRALYTFAELAADL